MTIPSWYEAILLGLAAWRTWRLLAEDDILDRPRRYVTRLGSKWKEGDTPPKAYRYKLAEFLTCPYCAGWWVALVWWGFFEWSQRYTLIAAVPFVLSSLVVYANRLAGD